MGMWRCLALMLAMLSAPAPAQVFWSVTGDNGAQNWLLGTVHSDDPRLLEFPDALIEAIGEAERLTLELVPDAGLLERVERAMRYPEPRLEAVIGAQLHERVVGLLDEHYGVDEAAASRMRPWAAAMTLSLPPPETGLFMDLMLSMRAGAAGLEVFALETVEEQLGFFQEIEEAQQVALLRQAVEHYPALPEQTEALIGAYQSGDLDRLRAMARAQLEGLDESIVSHFMQAGLAERNHRMLERAEPFLQEGGLIIAVGALHLSGEDGLLELLRAAGYRVTAIY
ncbi:MAG: TraB/GumN family protein [Pseudomonadota bacterium]|nr:MAG: TraB/GumN family protein [Pseudomonadota bacterium]